MFTGIIAGPLPSVPAMAVARSCCTVPITSRQRRVDVCAGHRERRRPEIEERMAECVDAIAVDVRHRAGCAEIRVTRQQRYAHRIARPKRGRRFRRLSAGGPREHGLEAAVPENRRQQIGGLRGDAAHHERGGDWPEQRAQLTARCRRNTDALHVGGALRETSNTRV